MRQTIDRQSDLALEGFAQPAQDFLAGVHAGGELRRSSQVQVQQGQLHQAGHLFGGAFGLLSAAIERPTGPGVGDDLMDDPVEQQRQSDGVPASVHAHVGPGLAKRLGALDIVGRDLGRRQRRPDVHVLHVLEPGAGGAGFGGKLWVLALKQDLDVLAGRLGSLVHRVPVFRQRGAAFGGDAERFQPLGQIVVTGHADSPLPVSDSRSRRRHG